MGKRDDDPGDTGSGRGGAMGSAGDSSPDLAPSDVDQERNSVVSGGGLVGSEDDEGPSNAARHSPSSQDPDHE